jgi:5-methyltetrahydropteroyltriglutamate--homocysteine methyltransferase
MMELRIDGTPPEPEVLQKAIANATIDAVRLQVDAGIDWVSDGEQGDVTFMNTRTRLTGFTGPMAEYLPADMRGLRGDTGAGWARTGSLVLPSNDDPEIAWLPDHLAERIDRFRTALGQVAYQGTPFLTAPSPGTLSRLGTSAFGTHEDFVYAIATAMRAEYQTIAAAGFQLQIDSPDLAMGKHVDYQQNTIPEFLDVLRVHVDALNHATEGIDPAGIRLHVCWGNYGGPHHLDVPLEAIIDTLYKARVGVLVLEQANPQHRHEWQVFRDHPLPDHLTLAAGVIDTNSPHAEHPQVVADSLVQLAGVIGRERLAAATDCGFATFAVVPVAPTRLAELKLQALVEGARRASQRLWP